MTLPVTGLLCNRLMGYAGCMTQLGPDVDLVIAFINTLDVDEHTDALESEQSYDAWLAERNLPLPDQQRGSLERAREVRAALRVAVTHELHDEDGVPVHTADDADDCKNIPDFESPELEVSLACGIPKLKARDPLGSVLAAATRVAFKGEWDRIKICPASDCLWAFYDTSRNLSKHWCSMKTCGNREKTRKFRERAREESVV